MANRYKGYDLLVATLYPAFIIPGIIIGYLASWPWLAGLTVTAAALGWGMFAGLSFPKVYKFLYLFEAMGMELPPKAALDFSFAIMLDIICFVLALWVTFAIAALIASH